MHPLLQHIDHLQTHRANDRQAALFPVGLFPSERFQPRWGYRRPDTNLFMTASVVFVLQSLRHRLSGAEQAIVGRITARAVAQYALFRNKDGLDTYNFWPPPQGDIASRHFANGWLLHRFDHFRIPDDIDDTALVYLTRPTNRHQMQWLHHKLAQHANGSTRQIQNTFTDYRALRAYSTWFGKTMPIEFDVCALSNLLLLLHRHQLPLNQHDTDSLAVIKSVVETGRFRSYAFRCAHNYARPALIIYHIARLMAEADPPALHPIRELLVAGAFAELAAIGSSVRACPDRLLLSTALLRLGASPPLLPRADPHMGWAEAPFFIAGLLSSFEQPALYGLASQPLTHIRWRCPAHELSLALEYEVWRGELENSKMPVGSMAG
jgi:hypothetical protein